MYTQSKIGFELDNFSFRTQTIKPGPPSNRLKHLARELERNEINYWRVYFVQKHYLSIPSHFALQRRRKRGKSEEEKIDLSKQFLAQRNEFS